MPLRTYWQLVAKRATKGARAALSIETGERLVLGAVVTITAIALLWLYGSEGSSWDAAIERVGPWIVLILAVYPIVWFWKIIVVPEKMDSELREKIDALEARLQRKICFTWRPRDNKYFERVERVDGVIGHSIIGRIAVKNISESDSVHGLEVSLINYQTQDVTDPKSIDRNLLNNSTREQKTTLHANREANFEMFRVISDKADIILGPFVGGDTVPINPGRYYIKVTASADNMRRENALFLLELDGSGRITYRMLVPDASESDANQNEHFQNPSP